RCQQAVSLSEIPLSTDIENDLMLFELFRSSTMDFTHDRQVLPNLVAAAESVQPFIFEMLPESITEFPVYPDRPEFLLYLHREKQVRPLVNKPSVGGRCGGIDLELRINGHVYPFPFLVKKPPFNP